MGLAGSLAVERANYNFKKCKKELNALKDEDFNRKNVLRIVTKYFGHWTE